MALRYCSNCKDWKPPDYIFCPYCGTLLTDLPKCPSCSTGNYPSNKFCTNCGLRLVPKE